ncbi:50S ribosomal protein L9 [Mesotoga sp.]|uniref:50S ribosomal protein L9 n=1 Tax=Mesotoga sp. TaxID=2053577 RepID=UPI001BD39588|nr:50S ribosomal protein L9 [Mesotoga sp.]
MKVILLKDVHNVGKAGEVKNVSDGYGRNFLIPKGFAVEANQKEMAKLKHIEKQQEEKEERIKKASEDLLHELQKHHFVIKAKSGSSGKLFGAVTSGDISSHIKSLLGLVVDKKNIELEEHIKQTGEYKIDVKLPGNVKGKIALKVEGLEED